MVTVRGNKASLHYFLPLKINFKKFKNLFAIAKCGGWIYVQEYLYIYLIYI